MLCIQPPAKPTARAVVGVRDATTSKKVQQRPARVDEFDKTCKSRRGVSMPVALECGEGAVKTNHNCNGNFATYQLLLQFGQNKDTVYCR